MFENSANQATASIPIDQPVAQQAYIPATSAPDQIPAQPDYAPNPLPSQPNPTYDPSLDFVPAELRPQQERLLLEWQAPARPFKPRNRKYYTTIAIIVILISLILFFAGQLLPIAVVIAIAFLGYVLSAVPPENVMNRITTNGIYTDKALYYWTEMGRFWFSEKYGQKLLHIEISRLPNQITLLLGTETEDDLIPILSQVLVQEKPKPTAFEQAAAWLQEKIPLDTE